MAAFLLALALAVPTEVERVFALVNGMPILASDVELARAGELVPREPGESEEAYRETVVAALVALDLRWHDLRAAGVIPRIEVDLERAWNGVVRRAGGIDALHARLDEIGLGEASLRELVRRAATVEAYIAGRFAPFANPTADEVENAWRTEFAPKLAAQGKPIPELAAVRGEVEAIVKERKLQAQVERWTHDLEQRAEVIRYLR